MTRASFLIAMLASLLAAAPVSAQDNQELIEQALSPLPEALRSQATARHYAEPGQGTVLRQGSNEMICRLISHLPRFFAQCHHRDLDAMFDRYFSLRREGTSNDEAAEILDAEIKSGQMDVNNGGTEYLLTSRNRDNAQLIVTILIPGATEATTGLSTEERDDGPWLMWAGTEVAHVMIPQD